MSLVVLVVLPLVTVLAFSNHLYSAWCRHFEIPEYEKQLEFTIGPIGVRDPDGQTHERVGITWVAPRGPLGRAGIRAGDIPRMYHGFRDFCGPLSRLVKGESVQIEVINVADLGTDQGSRRLVTVTMTPP